MNFAITNRGLDKRTRAALAAVTRALRPHVSADDCFPTRAALDVARNVCGPLMYEDDLSPELAFLQSLSKRVGDGLLCVGDMKSAVDEAARAWRRAWPVVSR